MKGNKLKFSHINSKKTENFHFDIEIHYGILIQFRSILELSTPINQPRHKHFLTINEGNDSKI